MSMRFTVSNPKGDPPSLQANRTFDADNNSLTTCPASKVSQTGHKKQTLVPCLDVTEQRGETSSKTVTGRWPHVQTHWCAMALYIDSMP